MSRPASGSRGFSATKKDGTNVFCSCREASDANYFQQEKRHLCRPLNWNIYTIA